MSIISVYNKLIVSLLVTLSLLLVGWFSIQTLHAQSQSCHQITTAPQTPQGYASPVSYFTNDLMIKADCDTNQNISVEVGNNSPNTFIYETSYRWTGTNWQTVTLEGQDKDGPWIKQRATKQFSSDQVPTYYVAYTCEYINDQWKCGCTTQACTTNQWQLQTMTPVSGGQGGGDIDQGDLPNNELNRVINYTPDSLYTCKRNFYVSTSGNNSNSGQSQGQAFRTIGHAVNISGLTGGDCVNVLPGTYTENVIINRSGSNDRKDGYLVLRATERGEAKLRGANGSYSALLSKGNYIFIDGLDIVADEGHAIDIEFGHHHKVYHNITHNSGGSGISGYRGDHYEVVSNVVYGNAVTNGYHTSGISFYQQRAAGGAASGYNNVIFGNIIYDNIESNVTARPITDGNGIIIDDQKNTQSQFGGNNQAYQGSTLVANNVIYNNGAKGVQVYLSDNVDVVNNTVVRNNRDNQLIGTWRGELNVSAADDIRFLNNIAISDPNHNVDNRALLLGCYGDFTCNNIEHRNNITYSGQAGDPSVRIDNVDQTLNSLQSTNYLGENPGIGNHTQFSFNGADTLSIERNGERIGASPENRLADF